MIASCTGSTYSSSSRQCATCRSIESCGTVAPANSFLENSFLPHYCAAMPITTDLATVLTAARALNDAVRHDEAQALLDSLGVDDDLDRLAVVIATAEGVARRDWVRGRRSGADRTLDEALALAARVGVDDITAWDLAMLRLRREYADALVHPDGTAWLGPEDRDPATLEELTERARLLHETAPDAGRRGW